VNCHKPFVYSTTVGRFTSPGAPRIRQIRKDLRCAKGNAKVSRMQCSEPCLKIPAPARHESACLQNGFPRFPRIQGTGFMSTILKLKLFQIAKALVLFPFAHHVIC
jgi:hypothetical protein